MNNDDAEYVRAMETARELITIIKWSEVDGSDDRAHIGNAVREAMRGYLPRQSWFLVEVLARGVAGTFEDLDEWSAHVIEALSSDE